MITIKSYIVKRRAALTSTMCKTLASTIALLSLFGLRAEARVLNWSGYDWNVRDASNVGPGPNSFSNSDSNVFVDSSGLLHLKVTRQSGQWYCASIACQSVLGYGTYSFQLNSNTETLDKNVVAGLFVYGSDTQEIDVELSRWGVSGNQDAQFAVQPAETAGNLHRFNLNQSGTYTTHQFDWEPSTISFQSIYGHYDSSPPGTAIQKWTYSGMSIPGVATEVPYINLWLYKGTAPSDGSTQELIVNSFTFTPSNAQDTPEVSRPIPTLAAIASLCIAVRRRRGASSFRRSN